MNHTELHRQHTMRTRKLVIVPLLAAIAFILQVLEFPLPLIPNFLKLDFSTLPGLIGGLMFGPVAGITIELLKNVLHSILKNGDALIVGEIANFVAGSFFICSVVFLHRKRGGKGGLIAGLVLGTVLMTLFMSVANVYVLMPAYAAVWNMSLDKLLATLHLDNMWSFILYGIAPFNIIKGLAVSLLAYPIFLKIAPRLSIRS